MQVTHELGLVPRQSTQGFMQSIQLPDESPYPALQFTQFDVLPTHSEQKLSMHEEHDPLLAR